MRYRIADLIVEMSPKGRTAAQAEVYQTSARCGAADITIRVGGAEALSLCPELETEDLAEYIATGDCFAVGLLSHEGMMLHASAVEYGGQAVCFSAPPGTGKSTHTEKWTRLFGASILNDDKPALRRCNGVWQVYGTPWCGKEALHQNRSAPLRAICFLFQGQENALQPLTPAEALPLLLSQTPFRLHREDMDRLLAAADRLLRETNVFRLICRNDDSAAYFVREKLFPDQAKAID